MEYIFHTHNKVAEVDSDVIIISNGQDVLDLIYAPELAEVSSVIIHQQNIMPDFFILSTGIAKDVLQKFVNYRCRLAIVGSFTNIESNSLQDFIRESNKGKSVYFAENLTEAVAALS